MENATEKQISYIVSLAGARTLEAQEKLAKLEAALEDESLRAPFWSREIHFSLMVGFKLVSLIAVPNTLSKLEASQIIDWLKNEPAINMFRGKNGIIPNLLGIGDLWKVAVDSHDSFGMYDDVFPKEDEGAWEHAFSIVNITIAKGDAEQDAWEMLSLLSQIQELADHETDDLNKEWGFESGLTPVQEPLEVMILVAQVKDYVPAFEELASGYRTEKTLGIRNDVKLLAGTESWNSFITPFLVSRLRSQLEAYLAQESSDPMIRAKENLNMNYGGYFDHELGHRFVLYAEPIMMDEIPSEVPEVYEAVKLGKAHVWQIGTKYSIWYISEQSAKPLKI